MLIKGIPSDQIVHTAARRNKDYELDFLNTDSHNHDTYTLKIALRRIELDDEEEFRVKLTLTSNVLAAPALENSWLFKDGEFEVASRVYHRICDEVDDVKSDFDRSMTPISTLAALIREAIKPISVSRQEKSNMLPIDEAKRIHGVSDWRKSIYSDRYPNMTNREKNKLKEFEGNRPDGSYIKKPYGVREKY